jgi:hypothetical protein
MSASIAGQTALPELEDEFEGEDFDLGGIVSGLLGEGEYEDEYEDEYELEGEAEFEGEDFDLGGIVSGLLGEGEYEDESEGMANPLRRVYPDAMMEHLGHAAAEAETEAEAEAFVGALVPLAARAARAAAPHVARSTPHLVRGLSKVAHTLRGNPSTRQLVRVLPTVASRTTHSLARHAAHGRPITPRHAMRTLAGQTRAVLSSPRARNQIVRRARALDRNYHRAGGSGQRWEWGMPRRGWTTTGARAPVRYGYRDGRRVRYGFGAPVQYGYRDGGPVRYGYRDGGRVRYGYGAPGGRAYRYGTPVRQGTPVRRAGGQLPARGRPRRRQLPAGLSIAWVPVPAWRGSQPPPGAYRY